MPDNFTPALTPTFLYSPIVTKLRLATLLQPQLLLTTSIVLFHCLAIPTLSFNFTFYHQLQILTLYHLFFFQLLEHSAGANPSSTSTTFISFARLAEVLIF
jgi:hypothetical protein